MGDTRVPCFAFVSRGGVSGKAFLVFSLLASFIYLGNLYTDEHNMSNRGPGRGRVRGRGPRCAPLSPAAFWNLRLLSGHTDSNC